MVIRRVIRTAAVLACLWLVSCSSIFDTYFPQSVEYLETKTSLTQVLGGQAVSAMLMGYLPATSAHSTDLLVIVASTQDGASHILFYDPANLSLKQSYGDADIKAQNGGVVPALDLIAQDSRGLYVNRLSYDPQTFQPVASSSLSVPNPLNTRTAFDGNNVFVFFGVGNNGSPSTLSYIETPKFLSFSLGVQITPTVTTSAVLDATYFDGIYYVLVADPSSQVHALRSNSVSTLSPAAFSQGSSQSQRGGWVTATAVILPGQADSNFPLTAYSWSGGKLATLNLTKNNNQLLSLAFQPNGASWFLYDSSTGQLTRNRPWW